MLSLPLLSLCAAFYVVRFLFACVQGYRLFLRHRGHVDEYLAEARAVEARDGRAAALRHVCEREGWPTWPFATFHALRWPVRATLAVAALAWLAGY